MPSGPVLRSRAVRIRRSFGACPWATLDESRDSCRIRVQVARPRVHELTALCEMICLHIWGLGFVRHSMGKCRFADLARCRCGFRRPIPERSPEPVRGSVDPESLQQLHERGVVERLVGGGTRGEDESAAVAERASLIENRHRSFAQRDTMLAFGLHPVCRNCPGARLDVDFAPRSESNLARPGGGQDQEFKRELRGRPCRRFTHHVDRGRDLAVG